MLKVTIPGDEFFDEVTDTFLTVGDVELEFEHSLVSLSKWESEFEKPFLSKEDKTSEETLKYVYHMLLTPNVSFDVIEKLTKQNLDALNTYINSLQSATTFGEMPKTRGSGEVITSELIYYWMIAFNIPFECQHWHINRLFSLVRICNIKNSKPKKMGRHELAARNRELNAQRREKLGTSG
jgi:hypothetical protein